MGRKTVYNQITSDEKIAQVNEENKYLQNEFLDYLLSIDRSQGTINQYRSMLNVFFVWNLECNQNKEFIKITKREFAKFQNHALNDWGWSPNRMRTVKAAISSLSNFIENIMDEEPGYENYRAVIRKIENPVKQEVREKSVFEAGELQRLLNHLVENQEYMKACLLSLAMNSGRRKAELVLFKCSYFSEENVIFGSLYKTPEKVKTKGRGKNGKQLILYTLKNEFDPYLKMWLKERKRLGIESEWLFPDMSDYSKPMNVNIIDGWYDGFTKFLGKSFYIHSIRHFTISSMLDKGLPITVVRDLIGHESTDTTSIYDDRPAENVFEKYFSEDGIIENKELSLSDLY